MPAFFRKIQGILSTKACWQIKKIVLVFITKNQNNFPISQKQWVNSLNFSTHISPELYFT